MCFGREVGLVLWSRYDPDCFSKDVVQGSSKMMRCVRGTGVVQYTRSNEIFKPGGEGVMILYFELETQHREARDGHMAVHLARWSECSPKCSRELSDDGKMESM